MSWLKLEGHDDIARMFARAFLRGRLEGSFLFTGPEGIGKRSFAFALAKTLLCQTLAQTLSVKSADSAADADLAAFVPCGVCESCRLFDAVDADRSDDDFAPKKKKKKVEAVPTGFALPGHPDFHYVGKPADKSLLPLELLVGGKEERGEAGLCFELSRTPFLGGRKIAVLDDADFLNAEGANALLKTLEEPPPKSVLILIGTSAARQLPTIRSRCQIVRFTPPSPLELARILLEIGAVETQEEGLARARLAEGSVEKAARLTDPHLAEFRNTLYGELARPAFDPIRFAKSLGAFVDEAGKEALLRRERLKILLTWCAEFYRDLVRVLCGASASGPEFRVTGAFLKKASEAGSRDFRSAAYCADRTLEALEQIDRNANLPVVIESWASDVARVWRVE